MSDFIFHNDCHKCGYSGESRFSISGTHLKQICGKCGFYIKFLDHKLFPSVADLRLKIWGISGGNKELIEMAKVDISFAEIRNNDTSISNSLTNKLQYWKLYLKVRELSIAPINPDNAL